MAYPFELNNTASVVISQYNYVGTQTNFELILNQQSSFIENRMLYCKEANGGSQQRNLPISGVGYTIQGSNPIYLYSNDAIQLHLSTNCWNILGGFSPSGGWNCNYPGTPTSFPPSFSTVQSPTNSLIVNPTMDTSQLFVDLRTESKTLVLPRISDLVSISTLCPFYTIKDFYGNAGLSSLFLSTSGGNILESITTCSNATKINSNYASIDILPNGTNNTWYILNYFNGTVSIADSNFATADPACVPSSAVTYVDTTSVKKMILLPSTNTVKDLHFYIKDLTGSATTNPIYISTIENDLIEGNLNTIMLTRPYESIRLVSFSTSVYSITMNNPYGIIPYIQR